MSTINVIIQTAIDYAKQQNPNFAAAFVGLDIAQALQTSFENIIPQAYTLATDEPDFESILLQLVQETQKDAVWQDIVHTGTGQTLLRNIAAGIAYLHFAVMRGVQETNIYTAQSRSGKYMNAKHLGVNIRRKVPQQVRVRLTVPDHNDVYVVPRFTQFSIATVDYFLREDVVYSEFDLFRDVTLFQGTIMETVGTATGIPYETIDIGNTNYMVSNDDVYAFVNDKEWLRTKDLKPWMATKREQMFFTSTLENGNVEVKFGNGIFGMLPPASATITIKWAETLGSVANSIQTNANFAVTVDEVQVTGVTLGRSFGGDDELPLEYYQQMAPQIRASNGQGVTRPSYKALATQYPKIVDAIWRGQAELNPGKRSWMNVAQYTILTKTGVPLTTGEWEDFIKYVQDNSVTQLTYLRRDPTFISVNMTAKIFCKPRANLENIESTLVGKIRERFKPRLNAIEYSVYESDLSETLEAGEDATSPIEFVTDITLTYANATNTPPVGLPVGSGIVGKNVIAAGLCVVLFNDIDLTVEYTSRNSYLGRTDVVGA